MSQLEDCLQAMDVKLDHLSSALLELSSTPPEEPAAGSARGGGGGGGGGGADRGRSLSKTDSFAAPSPRFPGSPGGNGGELGAKAQAQLAEAQAANTELRMHANDLQAKLDETQAALAAALKGKAAAEQRAWAAEGARQDAEKAASEMAMKLADAEDEDDVAPVASSAEMLGAQAAAPSAEPTPEPSPAPSDEEEDDLATPLPTKMLQRARTKSSPRAKRDHSRDRPRGGKGSRRLSLASMLKSHGSEKMTKIESMVELLTSMSSVRDSDELVKLIADGVRELLGGDVCSVWVASDNCTHMSFADDTVQTSMGNAMEFSRRVERSGQMMNIPHDQYELFLGDDDAAAGSVRPTSVLAASSNDVSLGLVAVIEVQITTASMLPNGTTALRDFGAEDEELMAAIATQAGISLSNTQHNSRMSRALSSYEFSTFDLGALTSELCTAAKDLFSASSVSLALKDPKTQRISVSIGGEKAEGNKLGAAEHGVLHNVLEQGSTVTVGKRKHETLSETEAEIFGFAQSNLWFVPVSSKGVRTAVLVLELDDKKDLAGDDTVPVFVGQAGLLLYNCQMYAKAQENTERVKQRLELLDISKAFAGELDTKTLMMTIIDKTRDIMAADRCALFLLNAKKSELWTQLADSTIIRVGKREGIVGHVATKGKVVNIADAYNDARFNPDVDKKTKYYTRSILAVPVFNMMNELIGVIQMINKKGGIFDHDDEELLQMIAAQAGVTLKNAQMYENAVKDQHNFNVLLQSNIALTTTSMDSTALLQSIMQSARQLIAADRATVFLVDNERQQLWSRVASGLGGEMAEIRIPLKGQGFACECYKSNQVVNIEDAYEDERFNRDIDTQTGYRTNSILAVPVRNSKGEVLGVTQMINKLDSQGKPNASVFFTKEDEDLLLGFTSQAAVSIENTQLFEKAVKSRKFLHSILVSITNLVMAFDGFGRLNTCNHSIKKYFGVDETAVREQELTYHQWMARANDEGRAVLIEGISSVLATGKSVTGVGLEVIGPSGDKYQLNYTISAMEGSTTEALDASKGAGVTEGFSRGAVVVFDDLTDSKKMQQTLGRYMSPALVNQVMNEDGFKLGGVRQKVSVLFSDIRSFTSISESMDAVEVVRLLNDYFAYQVDPIFWNEGILDKFIGDAIMAVFGVPSPREGDCLRACRTAVQMMAALAVFNAGRRKIRKMEVDIGIGINTGKVISGNIGSEQRMEYTVIGDAVNLASRLEGVTKTYGVKIVVSEFSAEEARGHYWMRELDSIAVKGKEKGIRIYEILGIKERAGDGRGTIVDLNADGGVNAEPEWMQGAVDAYTAKHAPLYPLIETFEAGLQFYRTQRFTQAIGAFKEVLAAVPGDPPSLVFVKRCEEYVKDPPAEDWDGVYRPKSK